MVALVYCCKMSEASASEPLYTYPSLFGFELETERVCGVAWVS